jgi:hypothetical protein
MDGGAKLGGENGLVSHVSRLCPVLSPCNAQADHSATESHAKPAAKHDAVAGLRQSLLTGKRHVVRKSAGLRVVEASRAEQQEQNAGRQIQALHKRMHIDFPPHSRGINE